MTVPTKMLAKGLTAPAKATPAHVVKLAPEGIVVAIVAVTGVVDAVDDLIVPGAFTHTLTVRRPKVVDDHEWKQKVGRVLHAEEWMPGDRRLPKRTKDGKPWPAEAGALVATMQYNLNSERGREAYEWVRFYAESNEAEYSIGYKVPPGKARKRADGVRVILMVDLFEFSHVLFGAAPLSMTLDVKGLHGATGGRVTKPAAGEAEETESYDDVDTPDPRKPWDDDESDEKEKAPTEAKTAASVLLEAKAGGLDRNRGNAEHLRRWFLSGAGGQIAWGTEGDWRACVAVASKHMTVEQAEGYCQLRHREATGMYTGDAEHLEGKSADQEVKAMSRMKGSYEERIALLEAAARDLLATVMNAKHEDVCVMTVATYATEAVFSVWNAGEQENYLIPYTAHDDGSVSLDEPSKVELELVAVPDGTHVPTDATPPADPVTDLEATIVDAMLAPISRLTSQEGKAADYARSALRDLLAVKGYPADDDEGEEEELFEAPAAAHGAAPDPSTMSDYNDELTDDLDDDLDAPAVELEDNAEPAEETVTVNPEDHFNLMDDLADDEDDEDDDA